MQTDLSLFKRRCLGDGKLVLIRLHGEDRYRAEERDQEGATGVRVGLPGPSRDGGPLHATVRGATRAVGAGLRCFSTLAA
ncbi:hypothetical protein IscW_ISCW002583 [Ixodes scapularis]|uniref:Uncharacterized protein n=1 Tax=Ixodes scapularis TaxID=6945 RepID=B7P7R2_IXOSC|nr:hypothetical protein IscW_ISCW002583 [Ixodes scapularis]|eukprot:XP_002399463.1 hypothetical protein IscW_ISCW002583 [Ixodes scapularis]